MDSSIFFLGFVCGLGLIVAIGAQNTFVLRQGLRGEQVGAVVTVSVVSDIALIALGAAATTWVTRTLPMLLPLITGAGILFLAWHGVQSARRAWRPATAGAMVLGQTSGQALSRRAAIVQAGAFSWLNPHAWLDTVVLVGSLSQTQAQQHGAGANWVFAAGAACASTFWFITLAWAARRMAPWFARPQAWRFFDAGVAVMMLGLAVSLVGVAIRGAAGG